jgi:hypothetical protein
LSTKLALTVVAGAAVAAAVCTVAALDDAAEEPVEGEDDPGLAAGAVWSLGPAEAGVAGPLLAELAVGIWPANPGWRLWIRWWTPLMLTLRLHSGFPVADSTRKALACTVLALTR